MDKIAYRSGCGIKTRNRSFVMIRPVSQLTTHATFAMKNVQNCLNGCVRQRPTGRKAIDYPLDRACAGVPQNVHQLKLGFREASWFCLVSHTTRTLASPNEVCQLYL